MLNPIDWRAVSRARAQREARDRRIEARLSALTDCLLGLLAVATVGFLIGWALACGWWR